jgi:hypothetical protein
MTCFPVETVLVTAQHLTESQPTGRSRVYCTRPANTKPAA